jgi:hypothetical protein
MLIYLDKEDIKNLTEHPDFYKIDYSWNGCITFYTIETAGVFRDIVENEIRSVELKCTECSIDIRKDEFSSDVVNKFEEVDIMKYHKFLPPKGKTKDCDQDEKILPWSVTNFIKRDFKMMCQTCLLDDFSKCNFCDRSLCDTDCESGRWIRYMAKTEKQ